MSVLATVVSESDIVIVADTAFTSDDEQWSDVDNPKVVYHESEHGVVMVGVAGYASHLTIIKQFLREHASRPFEGTESAVFEFVQSLYEYAEAHKVPTFVDNGGVLTQYHIVLGDTAWFVEGYFIRQIIDYDVIGSGSIQARTAMYLDADPVTAIQTACHFDQYCQTPVIEFVYDKSLGTVEKIVHGK